MNKCIHIAVLLAWASLMSGCAIQAESESLSADGKVISQLKRAGSNLSKEHPIEFYIYAPTKDSANKIASTLFDKGFNAKVELSVEGNAWLVYLVKYIVPTEKTMLEIRNTFNKIASSVGGEYDGWGTPIVK